MSDGEKVGRFLTVVATAIVMIVVFGFLCMVHDMGEMAGRRQEIERSAKTVEIEKMKRDIENLRGDVYDLKARQ